MFGLNSKKVSRKQVNTRHAKLTGATRVSGRPSKKWLPGVLAGAASLAILTVATSGNIASASVILSSNFNGSLDGWTAVTGTGYTVTDAGAESAFSNVANGASADLQDNSSSANPSLTSPTFSGITPQDAVQISFDFNILSAAPSENNGFMLNPQRNIILQLGSPGSSPAFLAYKNGSNWAGSRFTPSQNTWYHVILNLEPSGAASPTWGFSVVDTSYTTLLSESNIAFSNPANGSSPFPYSNIQFDFNSAASESGGNFLVDNVSVVVVPEPAPLALLACGLAGAALLLIPRRRNIQ